MKRKSFRYSWLFLLLTMAALQGCADKPQKELRIMSYNIRNCRGLDNVRDAGRIGAVILRNAPDVVALQELDSATRRSEGRDLLSELSAETGMHPTYAAAIDYDGGKYGIGILSRQEPLEVRRIPLPGREERRMLLVAEFEEYVFCCTHFSLTEEDRLMSVDTIVNALCRYDKPLFLAGDFNTEPRSEVIVRLGEHFLILSDTSQMTFPADNPQICIDYIMQLNGSRGGERPECKVLEEPAASDHRPVTVTVETAGATCSRRQP